MESVPCLITDDLTDAEIKMFRLAELTKRLKLEVREKHYQSIERHYSTVSITRYLIFL